MAAQMVLHSCSVPVPRTIKQPYPRTKNTWGPDTSKYLPASAQCAPPALTLTPTSLLLPALTKQACDAAHTRRLVSCRECAPRSPHLRLQEFHRAVADEVVDTMRPHGNGGGFGGTTGRSPTPGANGYRDRGGFAAGERGGGGASASRALPPPLPQDPSINPRGIEAIVKLRGLPFEASPRDVMEWINAAFQKREVLLSAPVRPLPWVCLELPAHAYFC